MFFAMFLISLLTVLLVILLVINVKRPRKYPPGPIFLPIIGSIYMVPGQGAHFKIEKWIQKYGNIIGHKFGPSYVVYITGIEESLAALKHPNFQGRMLFYHKNKGLRRGLFFNDGAAWLTLKRFAMNYFSAFQNTKIQNLVADEMTDMFSKIKLNCEVQINYKFFPIALNILLKLITSKDKNTEYSMSEKILDHMYRSIHGMRTTGIENYMPIIRKLFLKPDKSLPPIHSFIRKCVKEHRVSLKEDQPRDFIDAFLIEQRTKDNSEDNIFTDEELVYDCYDLIRAGSVATGDAVALVMLYILLHPQVQHKMQKELDENINPDVMPTLADRKKLPYCEAVIAESMRISPMVPLTAAHRATKDTEFYGFMIPKDTVIKVSLWTLCRDPKIWQNPDKFEPERFLVDGEYFKYPYFLPFGLGKRSCLMEVMARNMIFLYVTAFFQRYSIYQPPGRPPPSTRMIQGSVTGPQPFNVIIKGRH